MMMIEKDNASSCGCLSAAVAVLASPLTAGPLITEDPHTPGPGVGEFTLASKLEKSDQTWEFAVSGLDLTYGVGETIELAFEAPLILLDEAGRDLVTGPGKAEVGVKWRFLDEEDAGLSVSANPQIGFDLSSSSERRGITEGGTEFLLPFQAGKTFGPVLVFGEVGRLWREDLPGEWIAGLAAEYEMTESLVLLGEIHGIADEGFDDSTVFLNGGFEWKLRDHLVLLVGGGYSIHTPAGEPGVAIGYLGLEWTF